MRVDIIYLVDKGAALKARYLTSPHVGHLEIGVQQQVEGEGDVLARVVDDDVEVKLLFAQDEPVGEAEREVPHGSGHFVVHDAEHGLHVAGRKPLWRLLHVPADDAGESVLRPVVPRSELSYVFRDKSAVCVIRKNKVTLA